MNKEQMQIAIAEACGWTKCRLTIRGAGAPERKPSPHGFPQGKNYEAPLPDYLSCLNAMSDAVHRLRYKGNQFQWLEYTKNLFKVVWKREATSDDCVISGLSWDVIEATAEQRAEAFLKTIDKWVEG